MLVKTIPAPGATTADLVRSIQFCTRFRVLVLPLQNRQVAASDLAANRYLRNHGDTVARCEAGFEHFHAAEFQLRLGFFTLFGGLEPV